MNVEQQYGNELLFALLQTASQGMDLLQFISSNVIEVKQTTERIEHKTDIILESLNKYLSESSSRERYGLPSSYTPLTVRPDGGQ